jgi:deferrochelatase/peroxidase EfeB
MNTPLSTLAGQVDLDDIQGLVRFGYKRHTQASFLLLQVKDHIAARDWLAAAPVNSAAKLESPPPTVLQVAISSEGMRALQVPGDIIERFSPEFVAGMASDDSHARRLGDVGPNESAQWQWGVGQRVPHVLVLLYALPGYLEDWQRTVEAQCTAGFDILACLPSSDMQGVEPFGFTDGISQPTLDWERQRLAHDAEQLSYSNLSCLGEYVLGYPNEYGGYTERPLIGPRHDSVAPLPRAEDAPELADLGRNGSYVVMRQLRQDVRGFWQFLDHQADGNPERRAALAAAMVGRTQQGQPLVTLTQEAANVAATANAMPDLNAFDYNADPHGLRCPLGAHVRRSNPRNADLPVGEPGVVSWLRRTLGFDAQALGQDLVASTRFHRLLRRGREYGATVTPQQALVVASGDADPGLHFICLGANIARQFEFVQGAWIMAPQFNGLPNESDPLMGTRMPLPDGTRTDGFSIPQTLGPDQRLTGLPQFVTVLGGAYFFLPGIRALRYLATMR